MEREKLLSEFNTTLESLIDKTRFVYSEEFCKLDDLKKQDYTKDKMATEGHLCTLRNLLWGDDVRSGGGVSELISLGIISSMFGSGFGSSRSEGFLRQKLDKKDEASLSHGLPE